MEVSEHSSISTATSDRVCGKCGSKILADAPQGLCSLCLFKSAIGSLSTEDDEPLGLSAAQINFDDYELLQEIGRGGQGVVYRARQKSLNRAVALKVIGVGSWATEAHLKRFRLEAEAAASLNHPFIVPIHEIRERGGYCYFSMNLIDGGQLDEVVKRGPLSVRRAAELIAKLARTVHYAHEHGIVHRDIKPGNILLDAEGEPHLTDFGLARLIETESNVTRTTDVLGTPSYMAPEQASGNNAEITCATDIYALGAVFYQLLTGRVPFLGRTAYETVRLVLETDPRPPRLVNPKVDRDLSTICLKCLEKDPKHRYTSALALAEDLERWLRHEPIQARPIGFFTRGGKWLQRNPAKAIAVASLVALIAAVGGIIWKSDLFHPRPPTGIAVLPFQNLSQNRENAFLATGMQDEIITQLAKIGSLKVISRRSTEQYGSKPKSVAGIARELGVAGILEGSVQKTGNSIRVNVQLIKAVTEAQLWAETYDRELIDMLKVQSDIAQQVATALSVRLTAAERARIDEKATSNPEAYSLYLKGTEVLRRPATGAVQMEEALPFFEQAIALDPHFALAHARLALAHSRIAAFYDPSPMHKEKGRTEAEEALRLQPQLSEGHVSLGFYYGRVARDYDAALKQYELARRTAPNDVYVVYGIAHVQMRRGQYRAAIANWERATSLDPMNWQMFDGLGNALAAVGMLPAAERAKRRAQELVPGQAEKFLEQQSWGWIYYDLTGSTEKLEESIAYNQSADDSNGVIALATYLVAMVQRDYDRALRVVEKSPTTIFETFDGPRATKKFLRGTIALARGDTEKARPLFEAELPFARSELAESPDSAPRHAQLGLVCAYLGRKKEAVAEAQRAAELLPISADAFEGPVVALTVAEIYGRVGEEEQAITLLEKLLTVPNGPTQLVLKDWNWDPLRANPHFLKLAEGPTAKIIYD